jgi:hypothetical protein
MIFAISTPMPLGWSKADIGQISIGLFKLEFWVT